MVSEPYRAGFVGEAGVTLEVGGTGLEPSQALGKGKTPPGSSRDGATVRKTARGSLYCGASEGCLDQSWDVWSHLTSQGGSESGSRAELGARRLGNGAPTKVQLLCASLLLLLLLLLVLTSQCLAAEPLTQPRRGKLSRPATAEECAVHIPPAAPAQVWG